MVQRIGFDSFCPDNGVLIAKNKEGIISYTLAVRSLDGSGPQKRGVALEAPAKLKIKESLTPLTFTLKNTGKPAEVDPPLRPSDAAQYTNHDVYRLSVSVEGEGWNAKLLNGLTAVEFGQSAKIKICVLPEDGSSSRATVILQAASESDPSKTAAASVRLSR